MRFHAPCQRNTMSSRPRTLLSLPPFLLHSTSLLRSAVVHDLFAFLASMASVVANRSSLVFICFATSLHQKLRVDAASPDDASSRVLFLYYSSIPEILRPSESVGLVSVLAHRR